MQLMISAKMQRNTRFKPGRGSQILEQLNYDKENIEIQENSKEITKNVSIFHLPRGCYLCVLSVTTLAILKR